MDIKFIERMSNANGVSGFEEEVLEVVRGEVDGGFTVAEDSMRNLYIIGRKDEGLPTIMLDGHTDEVGFMVQSILPNGLLQFVPLGGWIATNIPAHQVRVRDKDGRYHIGVTTSKPPHFMSAQERDKKLAVEDIYIDLGASSYEEVVEEFGIEPGAPVVPHVEFSYNEKNEVMCGKAFDNRLGCAAVVDTMKALEAEGVGVNIVGTLSSQEEVGTRGSVITARRVKPHAAIVFEGTPADDIYRDGYRAQGALGKGPQIRHRDSSMISNPRFTKFARETAREMGMEFQDAVRVAGGTNGGRIHISNYGIPTIVLGVPTRYAHTHYGYASFKDYRDTVRLAVEIIKRLNWETVNNF
ncbi:peptidase M42 [Propionigenium maris DSM 9537]|uniref:Peptidase M42 n=1 Tax=Propionigenium maris DSM 9537 TaxID=1123000 RepID=A0A9W6GJZ6_9FUSO|nr:M20/M25/M40 family metallo-hydrolase [Propionigenium maris]GLI55032.1 peptidase M42 [Propionigenium maris DSM 9537]